LACNDYDMVAYGTVGASCPRDACYYDTDCKSGKCKDPRP